MLALCVRRFRDLETGKLHDEGDTVEVTKERFDAINDGGYGVLLSAVQATETASEAPKRRKATSTASTTQRRRTGRQKAAEE